MRVLVVGGGGREHAICWRLSHAPSVDRIYAAPGNAGTAEIATNVPVAVDDVASVVDLAERESVDITVVGPEGPLVGGLADELEARGMPVFGPTREGAMLEGSKVWARDLCHRHGIPAPASVAFEDFDAAVAHLDRVSPPYVVKADGLAGGKGVVVTDSAGEARAALEAAMVERVFGEAGARVLVEEFLEGTEVSAMALTDGHHVLPLALARDYKRALEGDRGPNTGGMGAFSPVAATGQPLEDRIVDDVLGPTVAALEADGVRYRGVVYAGLMMTRSGPRVLEFNCRFGDPEAQVVLPRLVANFPELLLACVEGNLSHYRVQWSDEACVGVVLSSVGYPGLYTVGHRISGLADAAGMDGVEVFHAGTRAEDGRVMTAGGRVLTVTALGAGMEAARDLAYQAISAIDFEGMTYRRDIARPPGSDGAAR
jgi:phosphoribosylamine---glycine ligase